MPGPIQAEFRESLRDEATGPRRLADGGDGNARSDGGDRRLKANRVRRESGLPELPKDWRRPER